jgi:putative flippase GtrA
LIGLVGVVINFVAFHASLLLGVTPWLSNDIAIAVAVSSNFLMALKTRLFEDAPQTNALRWKIKKLLHWSTCSAIGIAINLLTFYLAEPRFGSTESNLAATFAGMFISYLVAVSTKLFPVN